MGWSEVIIWGLCAMVAMTVVEGGGVWAGLSRMSTPIILGTMLVSDRERAAFIGTFLHLIVGWTFSIIYALIFMAAGFATWWLGMVIGAVQSLFMLGVLVPVLPAVHPRMVSVRHGPEPSRALQAPGFLALNYGRSTILVSLAAHLAFGGLFGWLYDLPA